MKRAGWMALALVAFAGLLIGTYAYSLRGHLRPEQSSAGPVEPPGAPEPSAEEPPAADATLPPAPDAPTPAPDPASGGRVRVRVVAANLSSGRKQSYDPGHGARILKALQPDVVLLQELNVGRGGRQELERFARETFGEGFHVHREPGDKQIPNGVVSRWPIRAAGAWEDPLSPNREFAWARIDLPGPTDLWAVSLHLLTKKASVRAAEGRALLEHLRREVPDEDYLVVGGDLNTRRPDEEVLQILSPLVRSERVPVDSQGRRGTNASRKRPYDWVLADRDLEAHHVPVDLAGHRFPGGLVFDTRSFPAMDRLAPATEGDSGADQMQHMAVVKDFLLPAGE